MISFPTWDAAKAIIKTIELRGKLHILAHQKMEVKLNLKSTWLVFLRRRLPLRKQMLLLSSKLVNLWPSGYFIFYLYEKNISTNFKWTGCLDFEPKQSHQECLKGRLNQLVFGQSFGRGEMGRKTLRFTCRMVFALISADFICQCCNLTWKSTLQIFSYSMDQPPTMLNKIFFLCVKVKLHIYGNNFLIIKFKKNHFCMWLHLLATFICQNFEEEEEKVQQF